MMDGNDDRLGTEPVRSADLVAVAIPQTGHSALPVKTELQAWQERCAIVESALAAVNDVLQRELPAWQERCAVTEAALVAANAQLREELPAWKRRCTMTEEALDAANRRFDEELPRWIDRCKLAEAALASLHEIKGQHFSSSIDTASFLKFASMLSPARPVGFGKKRIGAAKDGGYVMLDDLDKPALVLSLGVGDDTSWDSHMAGLGATVHQYDHTVQPPDNQLKDIIFHQKRIVDYADGFGATIKEALSMLEGAEVDRPAIMKMDIEGNEWSVLDAIPDSVLDRFNQITCEFHDFDQSFNSAWFTRASRVLKKINRYFQCIHVHGNNNGKFVVVGGVSFPSVLEVTYANRSRYSFEITNETFPTALDCANNPSWPDLWLGSFSFPQGDRRSPLEDPSITQTIANSA